jgi:hypothetical protein
MPLPFFCAPNLKPVICRRARVRGNSPMPTQGHYLAFHGLVEFALYHLEF